LAGTRSGDFEQRLKSRSELQNQSHTVLYIDETTPWSVRATTESTMDLPPSKAHAGVG
jgi:hypothetical protein